MGNATLFQRGDRSSAKLGRGWEQADREKALLATAARLILAALCIHPTHMPHIEKVKKKQKLSEKDGLFGMRSPG